MDCVIEMFFFLICKCKVDQIYTTLYNFIFSGIILFMFLINDWEEILLFLLTLNKM